MMLNRSTWSNAESSETNNNNKNHVLRMESMEMETSTNIPRLDDNKIFHVYGFSQPLTATWFFGVVGAEYSHTYFWIAKDLFWMQGQRLHSTFFGLAALFWSLLLLWHAVRIGNYHELWNYPTIFLWLFANFWWMVSSKENSPIIDIKSN